MVERNWEEGRMSLKWNMEEEVSGDEMVLIEVGKKKRDGKGEEEM